MLLHTILVLCKLCIQFLFSLFNIQCFFVFNFSLFTFHFYNPVIPSGFFRWSINELTLLFNKRHKCRFYSLFTFHYSLFTSIILSSLRDFLFFIFQNRHKCRIYSFINIQFYNVSIIIIIYSKISF
jgi:hypothetical protein